MAYEKRKFTTPWRMYYIEREDCFEEYYYSSYTLWETPDGGKNWYGKTYEADGLGRVDEALVRDIARLSVGHFVGATYSQFCRGEKHR